MADPATLSRLVPLKQHACPHPGCAASFEHSKLLAIHLRESPIHEYCRKCRCSFADWDEFVAHKASAPRDKHISCGFCGKDFQTVGGRDRHLQQEHPVSQNLSCPAPDCPLVFNRASALVYHLEMGCCSQISAWQFRGRVQHKAMVQTLLRNPELARDVAKKDWKGIAVDEEPEGGVTLSLALTENGGVTVAKGAAKTAAAATGTETAAAGGQSAPTDKQAQAIQKVLDIHLHTRKTSNHQRLMAHLKARKKTADESILDESGGSSDDKLGDEDVLLPAKNTIAAMQLPDMWPKLVPHGPRVLKETDDDDEVQEGTPVLALADLADEVEDKLKIKSTVDSTVDSTDIEERVKPKQTQQRRRGELTSIRQQFPAAAAKSFSDVMSESASTAAPPLSFAQVMKGSGNYQDNWPPPTLSMAQGGNEIAKGEEKGVDGPWGKGTSVATQAAMQPVSDKLLEQRRKVWGVGSMSASKKLFPDAEKTAAGHGGAGVGVASHNPPGNKAVATASDGAKNNNKEDGKRTPAGWEFPTALRPSEEEDNLLSRPFWDPTHPAFNPERFFNHIAAAYSCPFPRCTLTFTTPLDLEHHMQLWHTVLDVRCPACLRVFASAHAMVAHAEASLLVGASDACRVAYSDPFPQTLHRISGGFLRCAVREVRPDARVASGGDGVAWVEYEAGPPDDYVPFERLRGGELSRVAVRLGGGRMPGIGQALSQLEGLTVGREGERVLTKDGSVLMVGRGGIEVKVVGAQARRRRRMKEVAARANEDLDSEDGGFDFGVDQGYQGGGGQQNQQLGLGLSSSLGPSTSASLGQAQAQTGVAQQGPAQGDQAQAGGSAQQQTQSHDLLGLGLGQGLGGGVGL
ncbi:hypothetical protein BDY21DRAFT_368206 [Lineolata rhizophorae]|uniref:C2H2-type domain-containing protein n=1 Tax=Lineolata rhizophorae TaxID=578093 RepID=A0A6A6PE99_9PEZI|nr:hypothetical protein BDY21DRAFT_368206 [Lineolata rhizophorae]